VLLTNPPGGLDDFAHGDVAVSFGHREAIASVADHAMLLTTYIRESSIEPELEAYSKAEALRILTQLLFRSRRLDGRDAALEQLMHREAIESTGIGQGIAVPHARLAGLPDLVCAVGRVKNGVDFMAVDQEPVRTAWTSWPWTRSRFI
jgi:hypothetical protein